MKNYNKLLEKIIDYNKLLSDNPNERVFCTSKLNNLVKYIKQRNLNIDIQDIKAEMIAEIVRVVKNNDDLGDFETENELFMNKLSRIIYNNICFKYKTTNNMYANERFQSSIDEEGFSEMDIIEKPINDLKNIDYDYYKSLMDKPNYMEDTIFDEEQQYLNEFIDFLIINKKNILNDNEIILLNEMLYDIERNCIATNFGKNSRKYLKEVFNGDMQKVHNRVNSLILKIRRKYIIWKNLEEINNDCYINSIKYLYKDKLTDKMMDSIDIDIVKNNKDLIKMLLEYKLFNNNYILNKYKELTDIDFLEMKIYYTKILLAKNIELKV